VVCLHSEYVVFLVSTLKACGLPSAYPVCVCGLSGLKVSGLSLLVKQEKLD